MPKGGKIDRMQGHIVDSCVAQGKQKKECEKIAWAVVNKYKNRHSKDKSNKKEDK